VSRAFLRVISQNVSDASITTRPERLHTAESEHETSSLRPPDRSAQITPLWVDVAYAGLLVWCPAEVRPLARQPNAVAQL